MIAAGLSRRMAIGACVLGNSLMGLVNTMNSRIGATLHTPFPIMARMPFVSYFSYFVVVSRCALAIIWLGVQTPSYARIPNHVPESQGLSTAGFCAFSLYFLLQLPFFCIPCTKIQYFFGLKSVIAPIIFLAVFGSTLHKAGGTISHSTVTTEGVTKHGTALIWAFFSNLNTVLGNYATLGLNIADFSRYANKPSAQNVQAFVIPFIFTIVGLLGISTAAAAEPAYGHVIWNPIVIMNYRQASGPHGGRAAAAFGAIGLIILTLGVNISANSISAANDLVAFCPKNINILRGPILAAFIGAWAWVPWKILASAQKFLAFLGGYTIFPGPMTAILMTDYYINRRGNVSVPDMYNVHGIYRYSSRYATNWRSVVALIIAFTPPLPGFINTVSLNTIDVSSCGRNLFAIGYIYSFIAARVFYWALMRFFQHEESRLDHANTGEDIIAALDERQLASDARKPQKTMREWARSMLHKRKNRSSV